MRVLHIGTEKAWRGGENQIRLLVEGLKSVASDVENFLAYPKNSAAYERFKSILGPDRVVGLASSSGYDFRSVWTLRQFCREKNIELINSHSSAAMSLALATKKKYPQIKLVAHRRVDIEIKKNIFSKRKYNSALVDRFVCISRSISEVLTRAGVDKSKISIVLSAVDETYYSNKNKREAKHHWARQLGLNENLIWFGHAAALTWQKGFRELIEACGLLSDQGREFHCLIAGDGPFAEEIQKLIRANKLEGRVHLLGHIKNVPEFLLALDVLTVPSHFEGLGTILLEGAFAGAALIGTNVGGIPEIIRDNETGLLVQKANAHDLAEKMQRLLTDEVLREKLAALAKTHVRSSFSVQKMVAGNLQVYRELL